MVFVLILLTCLGAQVGQMHVESSYLIKILLAPPCLSVALCHMLLHDSESISWRQDA